MEEQPFLPHAAPTRLDFSGKHYAVHDGPEDVPASRLEFVANVTEHDMLDSYLPQFRTLVQKANVAQIMCAYSSVNRSAYAPDCANSYLLQDALRTRFGFTGMVISDNGALEFEVSTHHYYPDYVTAAAASLNAGTDNDLGGDAVYANNLAAALTRGLTTQATLDRAVARNLRLRFQLGACVRRRRRGRGKGGVWAPVRVISCRARGGTRA